VNRKGKVIFVHFAPRPLHVERADLLWRAVICCGLFSVGVAILLWWVLS
jgi:hypothetical protein